jgi:hypothetical protein
MPGFERTIDDVISTVRQAKDRERKCTLLIGAGCSVKAGVPLASKFVDIIKEKWPPVHHRADDPKGYPQCMAELAPGERRDLIAEYVDKAKVNWGHVAIAQLMKHGYVDRVLTTNFDPLVVRACSMVGHFPAVYDFAASQILNPTDITGEAVFYLHGQRSGFVLMNTKEECEEHSKKLVDLFRDAGQGRVWIVAGYSGQNDPVFQHLANVPTFQHNLFWVGYKDNPLAPHVREGLMHDKRFAFHLPGYDADDFFVTLAQRLGCFPPKFISEPFSHLDELLNGLTEYKVPQQETSSDITESSRAMIRQAIQTYEQAAPAKPGRTTKAKTRTPKAPSLSLLVTRAYMAGDYEKVIELAPASSPISPEIVDEVAWSYVMLGNALGDQAEQKTGAEADRLFELAVQKYAQALAIKPDDHIALDNWGISIIQRATRNSDAGRESLLKLAEEKCRQLEALVPGEGAYNLACICSLRNQSPECQAWLEKARSHGKLPPRQHLLDDTDLANVRETNWFQKLIAELPE